MSPRMLLNIKDLSLSFPDKTLFKRLSLTVHSGELAAIIGPNGCGKSTLIDVMNSHYRTTSGTALPFGLKTKGSITMPPAVRLSHLPQRPSDTWLTGQHNALDPKEMAMAADLSARLGVEDLMATGTPRSDGQLQKVALAAVLAADADLFVLDEPTNYLDIGGITLLEHHLDFLLGRGKGILLITHDRAITDNLADMTVMLTSHAIYSSPGGASAVRGVQETDTASRQKRADQMRRKIRQLQEDMQAKAGWAAAKEKQKRGAGGAKGHISRLSAKMAKRAKVAQRRIEQQTEQLQETRPFVPKPVRLHLPEYQVRNRTVFSLENVSFAYDPQSTTPLLKDVTFGASALDRICVMGTNGAGKSTLLKIILEQLRPTGGSARLNRSVSVATLPQGLTGVFPAPTLLDNFADVPVAETDIRLHLGAALIRRDKVLQPVSSFSQGELMRAALVKAILARADFLLLDEPTSHLDLESVDVLESLLNGFPGGFVVISHDRTFVENVADQLFILDRGHLQTV